MTPLVPGQSPGPLQPGSLALSGSSPAKSLGQSRGPRLPEALGAEVLLGAEPGRAGGGEVGWR